MNNRVWVISKFMDGGGTEVIGACSTEQRARKILQNLDEIKNHEIIRINLWGNELYCGDYIAELVEVF